METIRTENRGKFQFRLVRMKDGYGGVVNRLAGGQVARIEGQDKEEVWRRLLAAAGQASPDYFGFDGAVARFRTYCAMMLTAISAVLWARISSPTGQATCSRAAALAMFCRTNCSRMTRALRRLPIIPRNTNGR